jgi:hypothetical protein
MNNYAVVVIVLSFTCPLVVHMLWSDSPTRRKLHQQCSQKHHLQKGIRFKCSTFPDPLHCAAPKFECLQTCISIFY